MEMLPKNMPMESQMMSLDSRSLEGLKRGARAERGSEEFNAAVDKVAQQFEAVFLQWTLKSMRDATPEGGLFNDSTTKSFQAMYDQELVQNLSGKGLGLASEIARQLKAQAGEGAGVLAPSQPRKEIEGMPLTFQKTDR
ncbi:MAG TPA: rod-binding protein [Limnobacter sp.]|nr:rod-binding protein [Limnobacter sp.]